MTRDLRRAIDLYERFHQFEPTDIGEFHPDFHIPKYGYDAGVAERIYYRSDKLNPETGEDEGEIDYVHFHDPGVRVIRFDTARPSRRTEIPTHFSQPEALTRIGACLGFAYSEGPRSVRAHVRPPRPDWYATTDGGALFIIEDKRRVLVAVFGGALSVQAEGVIG